MSTPEESNPETAELESRRCALKDANAAEIQAIMQLGVMPDMGFMNRVRIDTFITFIFSRMGGIPDEVRQQLNLLYEIEFEEKVAERLRGIKAEARKAVMGLGAQVSPQQVQAMWNAHQQARGQNGGSGPGGLFLPGDH